MRCCVFLFLFFTIFLAQEGAGIQLLGKPDLKSEGLGLLSSIPPREKSLRVALLNRAGTLAARHNADPNRSYNMGLNKFSLMTGSERQLYLGMGNGTGSDLLIPEIDSLKNNKLRVRLGLRPNAGPAAAPPPISYDHRAKGHVTAVKDQHSCGSCWAFAGVGAFEGSYSIATGITKSFSAKEALDCSYPAAKNGCRGGWFTAVWRYIGEQGRLGTARDIPYIADYAAGCKWGSKPNGIKNAEYVAQYRVRSCDVAKIVSQYTPSVAVTVEDDFFKYKDGIYDGCPTKRRVNHGVILVGYGPEYWEAKNSWGADWGDGGYVKVTRSRPDVCRITSYVSYPVVEYRDRGESDEADIAPDNELSNIARGSGTLTNGELPAPVIVDGEDNTCFCTRSSLNPKIKLDFGSVYKIQKIEIVSNYVSSLVDSKVYVGNRGDFFDKKVALIQEANPSGVVTIELDQPVFGSKLYLEYYGHRSARTLKVCEIKVYGKADDSNDDGCPTGTQRCPDQVCRHAHMC